MKFYIKTFGCQMNVNESRKVAALLARKGHDHVDTPEEADLILINTCSVREKPEKKVLSLVGRLAPMGKMIGVMGCVAQQYGSELLEKNDEIKFVLGTQKLHRIGDILDDVMRDHKNLVDVNFVDAKESLEIFREPLIQTTCSAFVTIMQGCDNFCSYCIVPFVRGRERSRPSAEIISEIEGLAAKGVLEISLLGQNVNRYGLDRPHDLTFHDLLNKINAIKGLRRVRFITSQPASLGDDTMNLFGRLETLCESIHLPFQSGSDRILKLMGRGYTRGEYLEKIIKLRKRVPEIALSADVIVGFPGETEQDFNETLSLIREVRFDTLFSFIYTPRPFTRASDYPGQLDKDIKTERLQRLQAVQRAITLEKNRQQAGKIKSVLVEGKSKYPEGYLMGRTRDNRIVNFEPRGDVMAREVAVRIVEGFQNSLLGVMEEEPCI